MLRRQTRSCQYNEYFMMYTRMSYYEGFILKDIFVIENVLPIYILWLNYRTISIWKMSICIFVFNFIIEVLHL